MRALQLEERPAGSSVISNTRLFRGGASLTWTYAEASNDPDDAAHTDVAHEGKLRLPTSFKVIH